MSRVLTDSRALNACEALSLGLLSIGLSNRITLIEHLSQNSSLYLLLLTLHVNPHELLFSALSVHAHLLEIHVTRLVFNQPVYTRSRSQHLLTPLSCDTCVYLSCST